MKIIQINASYKPAYIYGGPTMSVSKLCEELVKENIDVEVITTTANGPEELPVAINKKIIVDNVWVTYYKRLTKDHTHFSPRLLNALRQKLKRRHPYHIVHIHAWWNLVSVLSCWIARTHNTPVILSPRGTLSGYSFGNRNRGIKDYMHRLLGKSLLNYCHFHVTSQKEKEDIERLVNPKSITIIPNFVRLPDIDSSVRKPEGQEEIFITTRHMEGTPSAYDEIKLLFISRIEEKKGLELLFRALGKSRFPWHLSIAGDGQPAYVASVKALAENLDLPGEITWMGHLSNEEKFTVMAAHDLMILPSFDENFANVVIECLSTGTAVLLTKNVGLADYVKKNDLGWVCERSIEALANALNDATSDKDRLNRIRDTAPSHIRRDFDEKKLIKDYLEMYQEASSHKESLSSRHA